MVNANYGPAYDLGQRLSNIEKQLAQLQTRDVLINASITQGGLTVEGDGSIMVNGTGSIDVSGGGSVDVTGGGSVNVSGTGRVFVDGLELSAVSPAAANAFASGYSVPTSYTTVASASVPVPAGYGTAQVLGISYANFANGASTYQIGALKTQLVASSTASTQTGYGVDVYLNQGQVGSGATAFAYVFTGLSGGTITCNTQVTCGSALPANGYNWANAIVQVSFLA